MSSALNLQRGAAPETAGAWHTLTSAQAVDRVGTNLLSGLADAEIARRQAQHGPNELTEGGRRGPVRILWEQVTAVMMLVLIAAATIELAIGQYLDGFAIAAIVVLNAALGFFQEYRAEKAMAALKRLAAPLVRVRRGGQLREITARELVPGDVIQLEAGNAIPADARLVESANLRVLESSLTGESVPVEKTAGSTVAADAPLGDRHNMLYLGTSVAYGRGLATVVATGMETELGRIATMLQSVTSEPTPLQKRIHQLGVLLAIVVVAVAGIVAALGLWHGRAVGEMFGAAVAIAVAAIPEGLPAVLTITLALGAQRMLKRGALIRKLPAVETLGSVTVICSDKTGTLTENRMTVTILDAAGHTLDVTERVRSGRPVIAAGESEQLPAWRAQKLLLVAGAACNDAVLQPDEAGGTRSFTTIGDPTEGALLVAAAHFDVWKKSVDDAFPRIDEVPFSSETKRMATLHGVDPSRLLRNGLRAALNGALTGASAIAFAKGSVDGLLSICTHVLDGENPVLLDDERRRSIAASNDQLAARGLRVLGVAYRTYPAIPDTRHIERDLVFLGMTGMMDPPRPEAREAVLRCREAGIRPVMITGDHPLTARQIASDLGIDAASGVVTGQQLAAFTQTELDDAARRISVFARVAPEHKLRIVDSLQRQGEIVAMTGDGVNDAPALSKSDIGVAMGITGTDVAKESSDMVITDDNFATIVDAVEEGRTIYDNVRKFVKYIVTSNTGEVLVMFLSQLLGMPLPMTTLQILWMNLVTDGLPGLALGLEPTEKDAMRRSPYAPEESIFSRGLGRHVLTIGPVLALSSFGVGLWAYLSGSAAWGTMIFVTLTLAQLGHALAVRSNRESFFKGGVRTNPLLLGAVVVTLLLQMALVYTPALQRIFGTHPLTTAELLVCLAASTIVFWSVELEKWIARRREAGRGGRLIDHA